MKTRSTLKRFKVKLAIYGINQEKDPLAQQEFDNELSMRPHILNKTVNWIDCEKILIIEIEVEGIESELAGKGIQEELFEIANAVLNTVEGMHVVILKGE